MKLKLIITICVLIVAFAVDTFVPMGDHMGVFWQDWPGGYALFGILACLSLIGAAKLLTSLGLLKEGAEP